MNGPSYFVLPDETLYDLYLIIHTLTLRLLALYWCAARYGLHATIIRYEVLTVAVMDSSIFWDITPYSLLKVNWIVGGTRRFHLQGGRMCQELCLPPASFLLGLLFVPEDGDDMLHRNGGWLSTGKDITLHNHVHLIHNSVHCDCFQTPGLSPPANYTDRATAACRRR
jgi:hypothetical protein